MEGSIQLSAEQRKTLLRMYRNGEDARTARRAQIVLLLADGWSYRQVREVTYAGCDLIADCARRFRRGGIKALARQESDAVPQWLVQVLQWLMHKTPQDFGYFRQRWSCEALAETLAWETGQRLSGETVRRGLRRMEFVWRRPRPVVGLQDPDYESKLARIQALLKALPADEAAVFQDEVDVQLNPKIGSCWMVRGQQAQVVTPGNNEKRHLAGSLHWRTGALLVSPPFRRRNTQQFLAHLDDLRRWLRGYRKIHVICDNASFHASRAVQSYLADWSERIEVHFLPKYSPETNPIERIWWRLHETLTRNHRCRSMPELLDSVSTWITSNRHFYTRTLAQYAAAV